MRPPDRVSQAAKELFGADMPLVGRYVDILISRGIEWGVIGPREADRIWDRHVLNSVAVAHLIGAADSVVDVGSGAGLPGIPLAILRPDLSVTCVEPLQRRAAFLELAVEELGLGDRVSVVRARAEELAGPGHLRYATVASRALAPLGRLIGWCAPLMAVGGQIMAIKGRSAAEELNRDRPVLDRWSLTATVIPCPVAGSDEPTYAMVATSCA